MHCLLLQFEFQHLRIHYPWFCLRNYAKRIIRGRRAIKTIDLTLILSASIQYMFIPQSNGQWLSLPSVRSFIYPFSVSPVHLFTYSFLHQRDRSAVICVYPPDCPTSPISFIFFQSFLQPMLLLMIYFIAIERWMVNVLPRKPFYENFQLGNVR